MPIMMNWLQEVPLLAGHIAAVFAVILGAWRPSARGASPEDDSADDGRSQSTGTGLR